MFTDELARLDWAGLDWNNTMVARLPGASMETSKHLRNVLPFQTDLADIL